MPYNITEVFENHALKKLKNMTRDNSDVAKPIIFKTVRSRNERILYMDKPPMLVVDKARKTSIWL